MENLFGKNQDGLEEYRGYIKNYLYKNLENNFMICRFKSDDSEFVCIGYFSSDLENLPIKIRGKFTFHTTYGKRFQISEIIKEGKNFNKDGLIRYFSGGQFPGIGEKKAEAIVNKLGVEAIDLIKKDPKCLDDINGLNPILKKRIYQSLVENEESDRVVVELLGLGIRGRLAQNIISRFSSSAYEIIKEDPYALIELFPGVGFKRADKIAEVLNISKKDPKRIQAALVYIMNELLNQKGNCYFTKEEIFSKMEHDLRIIDNLEANLEALFKNKKIIIEDENIYLKAVYECEKNIAKYLNKLNSSTSFHSNYIKLVDDEFLKYEQMSQITYTKKQKEAILSALKNKLSIITGGPGTGKTTIIKAIVDIYSIINSKNKTDAEAEIALLAPTGRAAKRMGEILNFKTQTIHKALEYDGFLVKRSDKNPLDEKMIIVDESSMIDIFLAESLLKALKKDAKVIFVGDVDQLPSVGPGIFFKDLIDSNLFKTTYLDEIHRQNSGSDIIKIARLVNSKKLKVENLLNLNTDVSTKVISDDNLVGEILKIVKNKLNDGISLTDDLQILIPQRQGPLGINLVNSLIQDFYIKNKDIKLVIKNVSDKEEEIETKFYVGDKVIQTENDSKNNIMNGNIGKIVAIQGLETGNPLVFINFDNRTVQYDKQSMSKIELAYAITIHKSQGSEYPYIIVPISRKYANMLKKELIYTAITRTRKKLYLLGDLYYLPYKTTDLLAKRKTTLSKRLKEELNNNETNKKSIFDDIVLINPSKG